VHLCTHLNTRKHTLSSGSGLFALQKNKVQELRNPTDHKRSQISALTISEHTCKLMRGEKGDNGVGSSALTKSVPTNPSNKNIIFVCIYTYIYILIE